MNLITSPFYYKIRRSGSKLKPPTKMADDHVATPAVDDCDAAAVADDIKVDGVTDEKTLLEYAVQELPPHAVNELIKHQVYSISYYIC